MGAGSQFWPAFARWELRRTFGADAGHIIAGRIVESRRMTQWKPIVALACGMAWWAPSLCGAATDELALTIYSSQQPGAISRRSSYRPVPGGAVPPASSVPGYALVRQNRDIELVAGQSTLRFTDVAVIDPQPRSCSAGEPRVRVLEQNFEFDLVSTPKLWPASPRPAHHRGAQRRQRHHDHRHVAVGRRRAGAAQRGWQRACVNGDRR